MTAAVDQPDDGKISLRIRARKLWLPGFALILLNASGGLCYGVLNATVYCHLSFNSTITPGLPVHDDLSRANIFAIGHIALCLGLVIIAVLREFRPRMGDVGIVLPYVFVAIGTLLFPTIIRTNYEAVLIVRFALVFCISVSAIATPPICAEYFPLAKNFIAAISMSGMFFSISLTYLIVGNRCSLEQWPYPFYIFGAFTIVSVFAYVLIFVITRRRFKTSKLSIYKDTQTVREIQEKVQRIGRSSKFYVKTAVSFCCYAYNCLFIIFIAKFIGALYNDLPITRIRVIAMWPIQALLIGRIVVRLTLRLCAKFCTCKRQTQVVYLFLHTVACVLPMVFGLWVALDPPVSPAQATVRLSAAAFFHSFFSSVLFPDDEDSMQADADALLTQSLVTGIGVAAYIPVIYGIELIDMSATNKLIALTVPTLSLSLMLYFGFFFKRLTKRKYTVQPADANVSKTNGVSTC